MHVQQFVMAYGVEQDRLRALLPEGFQSLRPVLRINAEIRDGKNTYVEFNTAVESEGKRGWLNIGHWDNASFTVDGKTTRFETELLTISFTGVGIEGGCPAEKSDVGCFFLGAEKTLRLSEVITANKEFCDCEFTWHIDGGAHGVSIGKTLPAIPTEQKNHYASQAFTVENAAVIPCQQVLGSYTVAFER